MENYDMNDFIYVVRNSNNDFTIVSNGIIEERKTMSRRSLFVLIELIYNRDNPVSSVQKLVAAGIEGRDAMENSVKELENNDYLLRLKFQHCRNKTRAGSLWICTDSRNNFCCDIEKIKQELRLGGYELEPKSEELLLEKIKIAVLKTSGNVAVLKTDNGEVNSQVLKTSDFENHNPVKNTNEPNNGKPGAGNPLLGFQHMAQKTGKFGGVTQSFLTNDIYNNNNIILSSKVVKRQKTTWSSLQKEYFDIPILCLRKFYKRQKENFPKAVKDYTPDKAKKDLVEISKLIRLDNYDWKDIELFLEFVPGDSFWSRNILSLAQVRVKGKNNQSKFTNCFLRISANNEISSKQKSVPMTKKQAVKQSLKLIEDNPPKVIRNDYFQKISDKDKVEYLHKSIISECNEFFEDSSISFSESKKAEIIIAATNFVLTMLQNQNIKDSSPFFNLELPHSEFHLTLYLTWLRQQKWISDITPNTFQGKLVDKWKGELQQKTGRNYFTGEWL